MIANSVRKLSSGRYTVYCRISQLQRLWTLQVCTNNTFLYCAWLETVCAPAVLGKD